MFHLNVRVAWHDNRWNGTVCRAPLKNSFCLDLERIRQEKRDGEEVELAGKHFADLSEDRLPPCRAESTAFMSERQWIRVVEHPYADNKKARATHGHLKKTKIIVPAYTTFAVPFYWMLRENQERIDEGLPNPLPPDGEAPFDSPWVFSKERQEALSHLFFGRLQAGKSLVFFYTKSGHPLGEAIPRLLVGVGVIDSITSTIVYETEKVGDTYPLWDRKFSHTIRRDGAKGFLLPYHDYLEPTGDSKEDGRRRELLDEIAVAPETADMMSYSYAGELAAADVALSALVKCLEAVRKIRKHGIAEGPWEAREEWLNQEIAALWEERGTFPGVGSALEALGMRLGTSLCLELQAEKKIASKDDPWPVLDTILRGKKKPPQQAYAADIKAVSNTWTGLTEQRRNLLKLLSRFSLSPEQARRWFEPTLRAKATRTPLSDEAILENPYRIAEDDLGDDQDAAVPISVIDRGLLPDSTIAARCPVEAPSRIDSPLDARRVRAAIVTVLRVASAEGDALLSEADTFSRLATLELARSCVVPSDWLNGNEQFVADEVSRVRALLDVERREELPCLQLADLGKREQRLRKLLDARTDKELASLKENWRELLIGAIRDAGAQVDLANPRHTAALDEQTAALAVLTSRKLSVLVGRAGTGKTTVLGALTKSKALGGDGILFLAPTGKARVRLAQKAGAEAMTVAQFLYQLKRYDGLRQRVLFEGSEQRRKERTVVIDECSMLTMDDMLAVLLALDLGHVSRVILVGDPNQLPPIGVGRPFADLVANLDVAADRKEKRGDAIARLTVELRTAAGAPSDALRLASWFTREPQTVDADRVLSAIETGEKLNDLEICYWQTPSDLQARLHEQLIAKLGLKHAADVEGFNAALGLTKEGWVPFDDHDGAERFQILSPVKPHAHGVFALNRWIQQQYRANQLRSARQPWGLSLGDEEIVWADKVILTRNGRRNGFDGKKKLKIEKEYLANGEIGVACPATGEAKGKFLNVAFAGRADVRFGFSSKQFSSNFAPLELAYALTVHKAQGSEFGIVFVVVPNRGRMMSRELLYTAITRSKMALVLLVEGSDRGVLYELSKPANSETARRNTNLFAAGIRRDGDEFPYAAHLVHRTVRNDMVQSKSELAIANYLASVNLTYHYNRLLHGSATAGQVRPDFTFISDAGELVLWEHLGMLDRDDYKRGWEWKRDWYKGNGYEEGVNLFTSTEGPGLDMKAVAGVAEQVRKALDAL